jgi:hypothetical protein
MLNGTNVVPTSEVRASVMLLLPSVGNQKRGGGGRSVPQWHDDHTNLVELGQLVREMESGT